jgi:hypothetical protein
MATQIISARTPPTKPARTEAERKQDFAALLNRADDATLEAMSCVIQAHLAKTQREKEMHLRRAFGYRPDTSRKLRAQLRAFAFSEVKQ